MPELFELAHQVPRSCLVQDVVEEHPTAMCPTSLAAAFSAALAALAGARQWRALALALLLRGTATPARVLEFHHHLSPVDLRAVQVSYRCLGLGGAPVLNNAATLGLAIRRLGHLEAHDVAELPKQVAQEVVGRLEEDVLEEDSARAACGFGRAAAFAARALEVHLDESAIDLRSVQLVDSSLRLPSLLVHYRPATLGTALGSPPQHKLLDIAVLLEEVHQKVCGCLEQHILEEECASASRTSVLATGRLSTVALAALLPAFSIRVSVLRALSILPLQHQRPAVHIVTVQCVQGALGLGMLAELDHTAALRAAVGFFSKIEVHDIAVLLEQVQQEAMGCLEEHIPEEKPARATSFATPLSSGALALWRGSCTVATSAGVR
mmetsp:Transcript_124702/g.360744  ORF Transcript_124702/g.360744 Transcript_124702/m.360744 type:complete len:380 (+) Transcript_124702:248-1387(+)